MTTFSYYTRQALTAMAAAALSLSLMVVSISGDPQVRSFVGSVA